MINMTYLVDIHSGRDCNVRSRKHPEAKVLVFDGKCRDMATARIVSQYFGSSTEYFPLIL